MLFKFGHYKFFSERLHFLKKLKKQNLLHKNDVISGYTITVSVLKFLAPDVSHFDQNCQFSLKIILSQFIQQKVANFDKFFEKIFDFSTFTRELFSLEKTCSNKKCSSHNFLQKWSSSLFQ